MRSIARGTTSFTTMESGHEQIDTSFEFQSLDLIRGKLIWFHLNELKNLYFSTELTLIQ